MMLSRPVCISQRWQDTINIINVCSYLQNVVVVVFREKGLVPVDGALSCDNILLPANTDQVLLALNLIIMAPTLGCRRKESVTYNKSLSVKEGCKFSKGKRPTKAAPIFIRTSAISAKVGIHTSKFCLPFLPETGKPQETC